MPLKVRSRALYHSFRKADQDSEPSTDDSAAAGSEEKKEEGGEASPPTEDVKAEAATELAPESEVEAPVDTPAAEGPEDASNHEASDG